MPTDYHAEHVGSLLRPPWLLRARDAHQAGTLSLAELREAEDRAVLEPIGLQEQAGLRVFTDGEARRESWRAGLMESLDGVAPATRTMRWYRDGKELSAAQTLSDGVAAIRKVTRKGDLSAVEARFMAAHAPGAFKITMISASMGGMIWDPRLSARAYPTLGDLIEDLATLQIAGIEGLIDDGVRWIQLDSLAYNQVIDPSQVGSSRAGAAPRAALEAARYVPAENLAISPQCGFASGSLGNLITVDDERRKLDLVVSAARQVWG